MCPNCYQNTRDETITHKCSNCGKLLERTRWTEIVDGIEIKVKRRGFRYYNSFIQNIDGVDINWKKTYDTYRNSDRRDTIYTKKSWTTFENGEKIDWDEIDDYLLGTPEDLGNPSIEKRAKWKNKNGEKHGLYQEWNHGNFKIEKEIEYKDGLRHGKCIFYPSLDLLRTEGSYFKDERHGEWKTFREDESISEIRNYTLGKQDGLNTWWYENGKKKGEGKYKNGKQDGEWTYWSPDGKESSESIYKDGKQDGLLTTWYENGQKQLERHFKDGKQDGLQTQWYENGQKKLEGNFKDGKRDGEWTYWYENGQKEYEGTFKDGELISSKIWNEDGSVKE